MKCRRIKFVVALFVLTALVGTTTAYAGDILAFTRRQIVTIGARSTFWTNAASVTIDVPAAGFVVVSASGMSTFQSNSILALTLATSPAVAGPFQFRLTAAPPNPSYQTYNVRHVFNVAAGANTFHLNGRGFFNNPAGTVSIETASITAEFYPAGAAQQNVVAAGQQQQQLPVEPRPAQ